MERKHVIYVVSAIIVFSLISAFAVGVYLVDSDDRPRLRVTETEGNETGGTPVAYETLNDDQKALFREALTGEQSSAPIPAEVETDIFEYSTIEYHNTTYNVSVIRP